MSFAKVSILIAARNEEQNLPVLLKSLTQLNYPKEHLEILIGNDDSTDKTSTLIEDFCHKFNHVSTIHLTERTSNELFGKTRVLEKLAAKASGEFLFFSDADILLPNNWIETMLSYFDLKTGVVVGITTIKPTSLLAAMQGLEWLSAIHLMHLLSIMKIKSTGMGNNMAVRKEAYWATGGYAKIPFSIVEDFALYNAIIGKGYSFKQGFESNLLAFTLPSEKYFEQRKRWLKGAFGSGSLLLIPAILQALFLPLFLLICFWNIKLALPILASLFFIHFINTAIIERKLGIKGYLSYTPFFTIYLPIACLLQLLSFLNKRKVVWKNRSY